MHTIQCTEYSAQNTVHRIQCIQHRISIEYNAYNRIQCIEYNEKEYKTSIYLSHKTNHKLWQNWPTLQLSTLQDNTGI